MAITNDNLWSDEEIAGTDDGQADGKVQAVANAMRQRGVELPEDLATAEQLVDALHELLIAAKGGQEDDGGQDVEEPKPYLMSTADGKQEKPKYSEDQAYLIRAAGLNPDK